MIDRKSLTRALAKQAAIDWVVVERDQDIVVDEPGSMGAQRQERRTRWLLTIHADTTNGRGSAAVTIDANEGDADHLVDQVAQLARLSVGPAWTSVPQAAPARVDLLDPEFGDPIANVGLHKLHAAIPNRPVTIIPTITMLREHVTVQTRLGFQTDWTATLARVELIVATTDHSIQVTREARRIQDLDLANTVDGAIEDLKRIATATAPPLGPCGVVFTADALLHGDYGLWQAFVDQADAVVGKQGLTRYHERLPIVPGADHVPEPLDVTSNGALAFGTKSAPVGDAGDAVREFALVTQGIAGSPGLSPREAALDHREPNGGVRNLIVNSGTWDGEVSGRVLEIRRLRGLEVDPYTGDADIEVGLGVDRSTGSSFAGGTLRLDLIAALARAKRSKNRTRRGSYEGPSAILIERAQLI
ncbi:MAG: hypothetical protein QM831_14540 [Kofleriaceae bacterium]